MGGGQYEQLDSGEFSTNAFNAESAELTSLFAHMSQLCERLHLPIPAQLHRPRFSTTGRIQCQVLTTLPVLSS